MGDAKSAQTGGYIVLASVSILLGIEYLGVVAPSLLVPNFLLDLLAPMAFEYGTNLRVAFVFISVIVATMTGEADSLGSKLANDTKSKAMFVGLLFLSAFILYQVHLFPLLLYTFAYPAGFILCSLSAFVIGALLKSKKTMDVKFGFVKNFKLFGDEDSIIWHSKKDGYLIVERVWRHCAIVGAAGSGKSYSIIEPMIEQAISKGWAMLIFDFKMKQNFTSNPRDWALTRFAYMKMLEHSKPAKKDIDGNWLEPEKPHSIENDRRGFYIINFNDVRYSHRVNPINPEYMHEVGYANEYAYTLLTNLEPKWLNDRDFFANSAIGYLKGIFWFLRCEYPELCTIPHAIAISMMPYNKVLAMLNLNDEVKEIMAALAVADEKNAEGQLAGVDASLKTPIDKLNTPSISWILSGNDFSLRLNDPEHPSILCLGSDPELQETYSPICALIATICGKVMNQPGMVKSMYMLDEAPQLKLPKLADLAATCRSNYLNITVCGQDFAQFEDVLGKDKAKALFATLGTHFYGQVKDLDTAKKVSEIIGSRDKEVQTFNESTPEGEGSKSRTDNHNIQKENLIHVHDMISMETGRFAGALADVSRDGDGQPLYSPFFNYKPDVTRTIIKHDLPHMLVMPDGSEMDSETVRALILKNHKEIKKEAFAIVDFCARAACLKGIADETKVFPKHFYMGQGKDKGRRIVSTLGEVMPDVRGITIDPVTKNISGVPIFDEAPASQGTAERAMFNVSS